MAYEKSGRRPPSVGKPYVPPEGVNVSAIGLTSGVIATPSTALMVIVPLAVTAVDVLSFPAPPSVVSPASLKLMFVIALPGCAMIINVSRPPVSSLPPAPEASASNPAGLKSIESA